MRVLFAPTSMAGHAWGLKVGLAQHQVEADVLSIGHNVYGFNSTYVYDHRRFPKAIEPLVRGLHFPYYFSRGFDIFHYVNATAFVSLRTDVRVLKLLRQKIFVTMNGTFSRLRDFALQNYEFSQYAVKGVPTGDKEVPDAKKKQVLRFWEAHAQTIFCLNPDLCHAVKGSVFLPYAKPEFYNIVPPAAIEPWRPGRKVRIAHAPTNRGVKGSQYFFAAVEKLQKRFNNFEVVSIEKVSNKEAVSLIGSCDILMDQLLVGWYGGVAVEAMRCGKPVIAYVREADLGFVPGDMRRDLPIINANPDTIESVLEQLLANPDEIPRFAERSLAFVNKYHDPAWVAGRVLEAYRRG